MTKGPYRWVRHPLYGVGLLEIFALGLLAGNWLMMLWWLIGVMVFRYVVIPVEEAKLIEVFDGEYQQYRVHTGAMAPRLWS